MIYSKKYDSKFTRLNIGRKEHNKIIPSRNINITQSVEYYYNGEVLVIEYYTHLWFIILITVPYFIIGTIMDGIKQTSRTFKRLYGERDGGYFTSDTLFMSLANYRANDPIYKSVMKHYLEGLRG